MAWIIIWQEERNMKAQVEVVRSSHVAHDRAQELVNLPNVISVSLYDALQLSVLRKTTPLPEEGDPHVYQQLQSSGDIARQSKVAHKKKQTRRSTERS